MNDLWQNMDKIHTTELDAVRIKRNLDLETDDVVKWFKTVTLEAGKTELYMTLRGKNWYVYTLYFVITINAHSYTIITAHKLKTKIRLMKEADYRILEGFLYHAIFVPEGKSEPPLDVINKPDISIYIKDFGKQKGDLGVVAVRGDKFVGAAWTRIIPAYGHMDNVTPELAISVSPEYRGLGIGTKLMNALFNSLRKEGYKRTSLSVQKENPAVRFYERLGYKVIENKHEDYLMVKDLT